MKTLQLEDLKDMSPKELRAHIENNYIIKLPKNIKILVAYESVSDFGCDSTAYFLFQRGKQLFEVHASHCSCYGFENQWEPEKTSKKYLKSEKFHFSTGGYDSSSSVNLDDVKKFVKKL